MRKLIILLFIFVGGSIGFNNFTDLLDSLPPMSIPTIIYNPWLGMVLGAGIFFIVSLFIVDPILKGLKRLTRFLTDLSLSYLLCGSLGLVFGLIISWLINFSLQTFNIPLLNEVVSAVITFTLAYVGFYIGTSYHQEVADFLKNQQDRRKDQEPDQAGETGHFLKYKVLDTSVIIDGRILGIIRSGFLEGVFVISKYVLQELQYIADSPDSLKRSHGRRGLDILNELQDDDQIQVEMDDQDFEDEAEVDLKLVRLAQNLKGAVITNDYNLNKVAQFQQVPVLNINELANQVKPAIIPGEEMRVTIVKKGTERQQGVAYLENGTMVVVEDGKHYINQSLDVVVTSSLQTNAGRMIFADIADPANVGDPEFGQDQSPADS
ncbi:Uncharacterized PIN and TRAM-domain containing protein TTHA0540 precursor [Alloiococcus otitis]|uniref:TRAM domain-containing protein n=1 Tax=Alloiococcus otitis ATCC 51267 TaxID=883081 RepID=K9E6Z8_9LACT|nr:PIN/TRAM domain-containing protein [Alloiococcus otitis]EKU92924.1 hypothetical protein HMPREF9698_01527 [Alloiococcus otitis ATCC 51267]SUU80435.1 Uncharacterized PIN and TRAM-domain containing protein TTHA0540 precursor [Alloiococcus otitis]